MADNAQRLVDEDDIEADSLVVGRQFETTLRVWGQLVAKPGEDLDVQVGER
jgi:hypothetical protein